MLVPEIQASASFPFAWKNNTTFGIENSHLKFVGDYKHYAYPTPINPIWWEYIYFKDTATNWTNRWGDTVAVDPSPLWADKNSVVVQAINQTDKAIVLLIFSMTNSYGKLLCKVSFELGSEAYIRITASVTNLGTSANSYTVRMGLYTYIAGDTLNDYFYVPGVGQGRYTGAQKDLDFKNYAEPWIAVWDSNKNQGAGVVFTKGFKLGDNVHIHDWYSLTLVAQGAWVGYVNKNINAGETSENYECYIYFFSGTGYEKVSSFYRELKVTRTNPTVTLTPGYQLGVAGSTLTYTVSITNNDPMDLGPSTFSLTYSVPSGWSASLSKTSVTLNPGETDSSVILSVTSATNALIGRYQLSITARDLAVANHASTGYATYAVASSVSVELFSASIKALDSQKEGVLEASTIVDNNIPNLPLTLLKDSIAFIPLPIPAEGMTKGLVDMVIKNAIGVTLDQITPDMKGNLHDIYVKGGFPEDIEKAKMNILELFTNEKMLNLQESPFVQDVLTYFRYIEELGSDYKSQVQSLVDAHNSQKVLKTISFCAAGLLIIISGPAFGLSTPAIMILEVGKTGIETSVDLVSESNYQKSLVSTSEQQLSNAYYFKERIISALTYVKDKMPGTFPHVSISGNINLFNGDIDLTIKNEFKANLKLKVMVEAEAFIPELIYREQTYVVPRISYGYTSEDIYLSDNAEKQIHIEAKIESWLNDVTSKLGGQKVSISFFACVRTFYGEDEILALHQELFSAKRFLELLGKPPLWQTQGSGTIVMLNEWEHKLYLHLYDQYGRHVGFNRSTKEIDLEIPQATYEDLNNRIIITLPTEVTFFTYEVDAVDAELATEGYNLNISYVVNGATLSYFAKNATIDKGSVYESSVAISPDGRKIWVNVPQWSTKLNQYLWTIPVIGELVKFFDSMSNGYGSLLLILTIVGIITVATVVTWRIKLKHKKS
jgi:hypothetical protein